MSVQELFWHQSDVLYGYYESSYAWYLNVLVFRDFKVIQSYTFMQSVN